MSDPLSLITDPFGPAPGGQRPFETEPSSTPARPTSLISSLGESERLQDAARRAPTTTPEQAARVLRLQRRTGFPVDVIERNTDEIERQTNALDFDAENFRAESPLLARWLADHPSHLALVQDDLRPLSAIERTIGVGRNVAGVVGSGLLGALQGPWGAVQALAEMGEVATPARLIGQVPTGTIGVPPSAAIAAYATRNTAVLGAVAAEVKGRQPTVFTQPAAAFVERSIYSGVESLAQNVPGILLGLVAGPAALLTVAGVTTGGQSYAEARAQGLDPRSSFGHATIQGLIEVGTEFIPAHRLLGDVATKTPFLTTLVHQVWPEIRGEEVATVLQDLNEWVFLPANKDRTLGDYFRERPSAAAATLISTLVATGAQTAVTHGTARVLEQLGAAARESKTIGRAPDDVRALVDQMTADGPLAAVHLPLETFVSYFQSKNINPAQMAAQLTGDPHAYARAQQTGEDLAVPMGRYLTQLAATEHGAYFSNEARLAPEALNLRETRALEQEVSSQISATTVSEEAPASVGQVRDAVQSLLDQAAVPAATSHVYANLFEHAFQTIGARAGLDPVALFQRYGLQVQREGLTPPSPRAATVADSRNVAPAPDDVQATEVQPSVARTGESAAQRQQRTRSHWAELLATVLRDARAVDPTVDTSTIRQEFAARRDRFEETEALGREGVRDPKSLLKAIADYGGLWWEKNGAYRGEIARMKESNTGPDSHGNVKGVFRKDGLTPDGMLEALRQDERFAHLEDINALLDAVDAAVREPAAAETLPGSADLKNALGIQLGSAWWATAQPSPAANDDTTFFQSALDARRAQLEARIAKARAKGRDDLQAIAALQALRDEAPSTSTTEPAPSSEAFVDARTDPHDPDFIRFRQDERGAIRFGSNRQFRIDLLKGADRSTFLHESAHFYLEVLGDVVDELSERPLETLSDRQRRMLSDYGAVLQWLGVENRAGITEAHHEQWARGFEAYLLEGKSPSPALRSVFARVRAWLVDVYRELGALQVELTADVRGVMDRLLASDDAIEAAQDEQHFAPLFTDAIADALGLSAADKVEYARTVQAASDEARDTLQAQLLQQLRRERAAWWREERTAVRANLTATIGAQPVYRALALLQRGTQPDGTSLAPGTDAFKLSQELLVEQFGDGVLKRLPRPLVYTKRDGVPPAVAAELLGFPSSTALVQALIQAPPIAEAIDAAADAEMRRRHGDALIDGSLPERARQAVVDAGAELFAAELKGLAAAVTRTPGGRFDSFPPVSTLRAIAARRIADTAIRDIRPASFAAAARRAGEQAITAAGRQDFGAALQAKQKQILNAELYRAATAARETVDDAIASFTPIFGRDATLAARYNLDLVNAARSLLSQFQLAPPAQGAAAHVYLEQVRRYDPELHADLEAAVEAAKQPGRPYRELTLDEFTALRDAVDNLWHTARRSRQIVIEGKARDLAEVRVELETRLQSIGTGTGRRGYDRAVTKWEQTKLYAMGMRAALRRVESWVDAIDGGDARGAFRRLLFTPISEAGSRYREAKKAHLERYLAIVKDVEGSLTAHDIAAPEIGYTFAGKIELLHALLHTGNESNLSKLLRGRNWGSDTGPDGELDSSRWDTFIARAWKDGVLTKVDYDYVQAVWDLNESLKPDAQRVYHDLYGYFFAEITAQPVVTPFGEYRGGYMPAIVDPFIATDAAQRADKAALEETPTSFMFPSTGKRWSKARIEAYARPLALDLRVVPAHLDQVLRFIHLQPSVRDAGRLIINRGFERSLNAFDPAVAGELLVPWLQRAAKQTIDTPAQGWGGRGADRFFRALRRRTGMQIMAGNVLNALQQLTGLSVSAVKVPIPALRHALWQYVRGPAKLAELVTEKSAFMRTRTATQTIEVQAHIDDLLLNPSKYEELRAFSQKHGYFLSSATQNVVDVITWSGAYDHAIADGATESEAVIQGDRAVRLTQGSFNPEDLSKFEAGSPAQRAFTMFYSYWNMLANTLGSEFAITIRDVGLKAGAGRLLYVYTFGFMITALVSELVMAAGTGQLPGDDDDDGVLDDYLLWFFSTQRRAATALIPFVGQAVNVGLAKWSATSRPYDDRISLSPAVTAIESAVRAPATVYDAIVHDGRKKTAIRDALTAIGLLTGLPVAPLGRPLGYLADVAEGNVEPSGPADVARGLVVGR